MKIGGWMKGSKKGRVEDNEEAKESAMFEWCLGGR